MGSVIGKRMKAFLAILLSVAMVLSLNPASALTAYADEPEIDGSVDSTLTEPTAPDAPEVGEGATVDALSQNASTTVTVSTYNTFQAAEFHTPGNSVAYEDAMTADPNNGESYYSVKFRNGSPDASGDYTAVWTWTKKDADGKDVTPANNTLTQTYKASDLADSASPEIRLYLAGEGGPLYNVNADDVTGTYTFSVTMKGSINAEPSPFEFKDDDGNFHNVLYVAPPNSNNLHLVDSTTTKTGSEVWGIFDLLPDLYATSLLPQDGQTNNASYNVIDTDPALKGKEIKTIYQLDVANDTLINSPDLVKVIDEIQIPLGEAAADITAADTITLASLVDGVVRSVELTKSGTDEKGNILYKGSAGGTAITATVKQTGGKWYLRTNVDGLGKNTGVYAVALPIPEDDQVTVTSGATNGTITPTGDNVIKSGSNMTFTLAPAEGYVMPELADVVITRVDGTVLPNSLLTRAINGNQLTINNITRDITGGSITVSVTFNKPSVTPPAENPYTLAVEVVNTSIGGKTSAGSVQVIYTANGASSESTTDPALTANGSPHDLGAIAAGSTVFMAFGSETGNNSVLKTLEIGSSNGSVQTHVIAGTSYSFTMTEDTQYVKATFEPGIHNATVTKAISGTISPDGAGNFGMTKDENGNDTTTPITSGVIQEVNYGDSARITVNASDKYSIDTIAVTPAGGTAWTVPVAAGATTQTVNITNVTCDYTVAATFKHGDVTFTPVAPTTNGGSIASVEANGVEINVNPDGSYTLPYNTSVTITYAPAEGWDMSGVWVDGSLKPVSNNAYTFTATDDISIRPEFTKAGIPEDPTKYSYVNVVSNVPDVVTPAADNMQIDATTGKLTLNFGVGTGEYADYRPATVKVTAPGHASADIDVKGKWNWVFDISETSTGEWAKWDATSYTIQVTYEKQENPVTPPAEDQKATITITHTPAMGGFINPAGTATGADGEYTYEVVAGTDQSFTFVPASDYILSKIWLNLDDNKGLIDVTNDTKYVNGATITFKPEAGKKPAVFVEFKSAETPDASKFSVKTSVVGNGTVSPSGTTFVQAGAVQSFSFVPGAPTASTKINELTKLLVNDVNMTSLVVDGKLTLTINADTEIEATFAERDKDAGEVDPPALNTLDVTATTETGGSVSPQGTQTIVEGATPTFTFSTLSGYTFTGMDILYIGKNAGSGVDYTKLRTVDALSMTKFGDTYSYTIPASFVTSYKAVKLIGKYTKKDDSGTDNPNAPATYTINASARGAGAGSDNFITPSGAIQVAEGSSYTFYFMTATGYEVKTVYVNGKAVATGVSDYTLSGVSSDMDIEVEFAERSNAQPTYPTTHTVHIPGSFAGGTVSPSGDITVPDGEGLTLTFIPGKDAATGENCIVKKVTITIDGEEIDVTKKISGSTYTIAPVTSDVTVDVVFEAIPNTADDPTNTEVDIKGGTVSPEPPVITNGDNPGTTIVIEPTAPNDPNDPDLTIKNGKITVTMDDGLVAEITLTPKDVQKIIEDGWTLDTGDILELEGAKNATVLANPNGVTDKNGNVLHVNDKVDLTDYKPLKSIDKIEMDIDKGKPGQDPTSGQPDPTNPAPPQGTGPEPSYPTNSDTVQKYAQVNTKVTCNGVTTDGVSAGGIISPTSDKLPVGADAEGNAYKYTYIVAAFEGYYLSEIPTLSIGDGSSVTALPDWNNNGDGTFTLTLPESAQDGVFDISLAFAQIPTVVVPDTYKINVSSNGHGIVQPAGNADGDVIVAAGGKQSFSFIPDEGYQLDHITVTHGGLVRDLSNIGASYTISNVASDAKIVATFVKISDLKPEDPIKPTYETFEVNATANTGGQIIPSGSTKVNSGASLSFTLKADTGYKFSYLTVDGSTIIPSANLTNNQYTLNNIKENHNIAATFAKVNDDGTIDEPQFSNYNIAVNAGADGAVGGYVTPSGMVSVMQGKTASVAVQPYFGYEIGSINIIKGGEETIPVAITNKTGQTVNLDFRGDGNYTFEVTFVKSDSSTDPGDVDTKTRYVITASVLGGNGWISPAGTQTVAKGSNQTFTVVPVDGYKLDKVTINGSPITVTGNTFNVTDIDTNMTVVAQFVEKQPGEVVPIPGENELADVVSYTAGPGTISPVGRTTMVKGNTITYTMTPNAGCSFAMLTVNGVDRTADVAANMTYELRVTADAEVIATFADENGNTQTQPNELPVDVIIKTKVSGTGQQLAGKVVALGGKTSNNGSTTLVTRGDAVDFVIMPDDGYYAASAYYEYDGKNTSLTIRPLSERGTSGASTMNKVATGGRAAIPAAAVSTLPDGGIDVAELLGIEKAYAAGAIVQKTYSFVTVPNVQGPITLYVEFKPCEEDPANPDDDYYSYEDQRKNIGNLLPDVSGGATIKPSTSDIIIDLDPTHDPVTHEIIMEPVNFPDEPIMGIEIGGNAFPSWGTDDDKKALAQDPERFASEFNSWASSTFAPGPAPTLTANKGSDGKPDGSYTMLFNDKIVKDNVQGLKDWVKSGKPLIKVIGAGENGEIYAYDVNITVESGEHGTFVIVRSNDNKEFNEGGVMRMSPGGTFAVLAYPEDGYEPLIETTGGIQETAAPAMFALSRAATNPAVTHNYIVNNHGTIKASFVERRAGASEYSVKVVVNGRGSVSPSTYRIYNVDDPAPVYTLTPATNYQVKSIKIDGVEQSFTGSTFVFPKQAGGTNHTLEVTFGTNSSGGSNGVIGSGIKTLQSLAQTGDLQMPLILILSAIACAALGVAIIGTGRRNKRTAKVTHRR